MEEKKMSDNIGTPEFRKSSGRKLYQLPVKTTIIEKVEPVKQIRVPTDECEAQIEDEPSYLAELCADLFQEKLGISLYVGTDSDIIQTLSTD